MIIGGIDKQPFEIEIIGIDFKLRVGAGETLSTPVVTARDEASGADTTGDVLSGDPVVAGTIVTQKVAAGTSGTRHIVQFRVPTSTGRAVEDELTLTVQEH